MLYGCDCCNEGVGRGGRWCGFLCITGRSEYPNAGDQAGCLGGCEARPISSRTPGVIRRAVHPQVTLIRFVF